MRKPILLSKNTCAVIWMYRRSDEFEDMAAMDNYDGAKIWEDAAKQFVSQLKRKWSVNFLKALIKECEKELDTLPQKKNVRKAWCPDCDGWVEGGKTLQTTCSTCKGKGKI